MISVWLASYLVLLLKQSEQGDHDDCLSRSQYADTSLTPMGILVKPESPGGGELGNERGGGGGRAVSHFVEHSNITVLLLFFVAVVVLEGFEGGGGGER